MRVYLVVVAGRAYCPVVFASAVAAEDWAAHQNSVNHHPEGMWIVIEAIPMDFAPAKV